MVWACLCSVAKVGFVLQASFEHTCKTNQRFWYNDKGEKWGRKASVPVSQTASRNLFKGNLSLKINPFYYAKCKERQALTDSFLWLFFDHRKSGKSWKENMPRADFLWGQQKNYRGGGTTSSSLYEPWISPCALMTPLHELRFGPQHRGLKLIKSSIVWAPHYQRSPSQSFDDLVMQIPQGQIPPQYPFFCFPLTAAVSQIKQPTLLHSFTK